MDSEITKTNLIKLVKSQQGELDAVVLYRKLAKLVNDEHKSVFLRIASDEGRHASILKQYTKKNLKPKEFKSIAIILMYKIVGLKITLNIISKGEIKASQKYETLVNDFPKIKEIILDEKRHGEILGNIV
jgi:rubrerythrin